MSTVPDISAHNRIAAELVEMNAFRRLEDVQDIIADLPFRELIAPAPTTGAQAQVLAAVCASIPRGLAILLETISLLGKGPVRPQLFLTLDDLLRMGLRWEQLYDLKERLSGVRVNDGLAAEAWGLVVPPGSEVPRPFPKNDTVFLWCIDSLAEKKMTPAEAPLFAFLELCRDAFGQAAAAVEQWEAWSAAELGLQLENIRTSARRHRRPVSPPAGGPRPTQHPSVLLVRIRPRAQGRLKFELQAWLFPAGTDPEPIRLPDEFAERPLTKTEAQKAMDRVIQQALNTPRRLGQIRIEVILPVELLYEAVDDWTFKSGFDRVTIGRQYPIVVRSWERLYEQDFGGPRQRCLDHWARLEAGLAPAGQCYWGDEQALSRERLRETLEQRATLVFLALDLAGASQAKSAREVLEVIVGAGVPLALWLRGHTGDPNTTRELLTRLLSPASFHDWPGKVLDLRRVCQQLPCQGLALFWDNLSLLPPDQEAPGRSIRLQPPT